MADMADEFLEAVERSDELATANREAKRLGQRVLELEHDLRSAVSIRDHEARIPSWTSPKRRRKNLSCVPVLLLSDWHFGEVIDPRQVDGFNEYDADVALARWERVINETPATIQRHLHGYSLDYAVIGLLGDMLSGDIHDELSNTNSYPIPEVISTWVPRIVAGLKHLADELPVERIVVPCVDGNHDRTGKKMGAKQRATSSWSWVIYQWIADSLKDDDRFTFLISRSSEVWLPIYDLRTLFVHGDSARGGGGIGGIWPPIMRYVHKTQTAHQAMHRPVDYVCMGHFHQWTIGKNFLINGSGKGFDEFARSMSFPPERAQQALFAVTPDRGVIMHTSVHAD